MSVCSVCNGIQQLEAACPSCSRIAEDCGRATDWMGPYAPYEPIDVEIAANHELASSCRHAAYCSQCNYAFEVLVANDWD